MHHDACLTVELDVAPVRLGVCRLAGGERIPEWVDLDGGGFVSVTRTPTELSIVVDETVVPDDVTAERGWRALAVRGPLAFSMTGVLAALARPLADAGIPVFVVSTYDTDWILVREPLLGKAGAALRAAGHAVHADDGGAAPT